MIQILQAQANDQDAIRNLVSYYIYDLSAVMGWECPESGRYGGCDELPQYWGGEPDHPSCRWPAEWRGYPFLIRVSGRLAGFALVRERGDEDPVLRDVGDFFILRRYRGQGVGRQAAFSLFDRFPGPWEVAQMQGNQPAILFWRKVIAAYTGGVYQEREWMDPMHAIPLVAQRFCTPMGR